MTTYLESVGAHSFAPKAQCVAAIRRIGITGQLACNLSYKVSAVKESRSHDSVGNWLVTSPSGITSCLQLLAYQLLSEFQIPNSEAAPSLLQLITPNAQDIGGGLL